MSGTATTSKTPREIAVHNERAKLRATALNSLAVSGFVSGGVVQIVTFFLSQHITPVYELIALVICLICSVVAVGLHLLAVRLLGEIEV